MLWLRKSKKGFTLIELMVVVAIIGVLSLLGLRLYTGQQAKAKNAVVKANCGTIQTLIQAELADRPVSDLDTIPDDQTDYIFSKAGIYNPIDGSAQNTCPDSESAATAGQVWVSFSNNVFGINGKNADNSGNVYDNNLTARK